MVLRGQIRNKYFNYASTRCCITLITNSEHSYMIFFNYCHWSDTWKWSHESKMIMDGKAHFTHSRPLPPFRPSKFQSRLKISMTVAKKNILFIINHFF